jgi:type IV secretion system protein TrbI
MSGTIPPPPQGLPPPPRSVRALRIGAILVALFVVGTGIAGIVWWSLHSLGEQPGSKVIATTQGTGQGVSMADLLSSAPTGTEIPAANRRRQPASIAAAASTPEQVPPPAPAAQPEPVQPPDDMTDAAIAGRRAAWANYYQQLAEQQKDRADRRKAALASDTVPQAATENAAASTGALPGQNEQQRPKSFFEANASNPATDYLPFTLTDPISPYELKAGDIITGRLISGLDSDSPGEVIATVTKNVDDYATGNHILIPQGSRLVGVYNTAVAYGETRVMVAWQRIIYPGPCSQSLDLEAMPGADATGQAGFSDITENHYGKIFLNALLVSLFSAGIQLSQPPSSAFQQYNPVQTAGGAIGSQMGQLGMEFARKGMSIPPTQRIRQGYEFAILTTKDIAFSKPWVAGVCGDMSIDVAMASR